MVTTFTVRYVSVVLLSPASFFPRLPPSLQTLLSLQLDVVLGHTFGVFFDAFPFWLLSAPVSLRVEVLFVRAFVRTCTGLVTRLREVPLLALAKIYKGPSSLRQQRGMAMARFVGAFLAGLAAGTAAAVQNDGFRGRHLPSSHGRDAGEAYARVSFKPERAFNVIAHVRDWEHAETVCRRCLRTVGGFVLQVECTRPG